MLLKQSLCKKFLSSVAWPFSKCRKRYSAWLNGNTAVLDLSTNELPGVISSLYLTRQLSTKTAINLNYLTMLAHSCWKVLHSFRESTSLGTDFWVYLYEIMKTGNMLVRKSVSYHILSCLTGLLCLQIHCGLC